MQEVTYHGLDICQKIQGQTKVAKKWLKSLAVTHDELRKTPKFYQHETKTVLGICLNPNKGDPEKRFSILYRTFMKFD